MDGFGTSCGFFFSYGYLTTTNTCDYLWIRFFVLGILVGIRFYDLLMQKVGFLSLWMASMYVQWQWHNRRWDHSCLRCCILWFCCGYQDGGLHVIWSMMVDMLGGIVSLFIFVATDWLYEMYTTRGRLLILLVLHTLHNIVI